MCNYKLTNKAVNDLTNIWNYTFDKWSEKQADKYYALLIESCQFISDNTNIGKKYSGVKEELLGLKVNKHIIFYRRINDFSVEITRILHEQMDLKSRIHE